METLRISLIQEDLIWERPEKNKQLFDQHLQACYDKTDLVILPEMFTTGFSMNAIQLAHDSSILQYLKTHAITGDLAIYGSVMFKANNDRYVNRGFFVYPDGTYEYYDKRHLFTLAGEQNTYTAGAQLKTVEYKGWKILLQICYDLRFPVFSRNTQGYDLALYVANWPVVRIDAWDTLLKARSIENMTHTVGLNRVGKDGTGMDYTGHSQVYDVLGKPLLDHPWENAGIKHVALEKKTIEKYRTKLSFLKDSDSFTLDL